MKILLLAPYYYPYINPRAHRWTAIAEQWAAEGHEVHVICSRRQGFPRDQQIKGVHVHRVGYNSLKEVFYDLFRVKSRRGEVRQNGAPNGHNAAMSRISAWINQALVWLNDHFWKPFYFPDDACIWYFPARRCALQLLKQQDFDALVSISLPFTAHLVGLSCRKKLPGLRWLADIGDPFAVQTGYLRLNNKFFYKKLSTRLERKVLHSADKIAVTVGAAAEFYIRRFHLPEGKIAVIPPLGISENAGQNARKIIETPPDKIHLGYFGSFFPIVREPDGLLRLLEAVFEQEPAWREQVQVHFFGEVFEYFKKTFRKYPDLTKNLRFHGLIAREDVPYAMRQMDFLVHIGNRTTFQLPSKSSDYLLSGQPILHICTQENDTFAVFLKGYPLLHQVLVTEKVIDASPIRNFLKKEKGKRVGEEWLRNRRTQVSVRHISHLYLQLLRPEE